MPKDTLPFRYMFLVPISLWYLSTRSVTPKNTIKYDNARIRV